VNRSKRLYVLAGVLVVAVVVTLVVMRVQERQEQIKTSGETVLAVPADDVTALSWDYAGTTLAFHKADTWVYDDDSAFPVDDAKIADMLGTFEAFAAAFVIEDVTDFGQYGLDSPTATITLATADDSYTVELGGFSTLDQERYVSLGDGNVYLAVTDPLETFDATLSDVIANDVTPSFQAVSQIRFAGADSYTVTHEADSAQSYCPDDVYFAAVDGADRPLDTTLVEGYLSTISGLYPTDYVTYKATDADLAAYGLDGPELTVTVDYTTATDGGDVPGTFELAISRDPAERAAAEAAASAAPTASADASEEATAAADVTAYLRIGQSPIVYRLDATTYAALMAAGYNDLRHQDVFCGDFAKVEAVDVALDDADYTITAGGDEDERTYTYDGDEVDLADFQAALAALTVTTFTADPPADKAEIGLTLHLDNANFPEVTIGLYRADGTHCLAVVDGQPVGLVDRSAVVDLIETVHAIVLN